MSSLKVTKCTRKWLYSEEEKVDYFNASVFVISTLEKALHLITENKNVGVGAGINEAGMQD